MADPTNDPAPAPTDPPAGPPADPAPSDPKASDEPPADPPADPGKGSKEAVLADLVRERAKRQDLEGKLTEFQATQQQQMDAIAKALGLKSDDTPPDPAALTAEIEAEKANARAANLQLAVFKAAGEHEANAALLLDSASFLASLNDVDPADAAAVGAAIKSAVDANAHFKTALPTPPFGGGPRPPAPAQAGTLGDAIKARVAGTR